MTLLIDLVEIAGSVILVFVIIRIVVLALLKSQKVGKKLNQKFFMKKTK